MSSTTAPTLQRWRRRTSSGDDAERGAISYRRCNDACGLCQPETYARCVLSGLYFFFCHAVAIVILHICCCRCLASKLETPEQVQLRNNAERVFAFVLKQLSNLWASSLILFIAWLIFFKPFDATPTLGASVVHEFQLQEQQGQGQGQHQLRFNLTAHLLLKNTHVIYSIGYNHPAMAVFYAGEKLGPTDDMLQPFKQGPIQWTVLDQPVVGWLRNASGRVADTYRDDLSWGSFQMLVRFWVKLTYKFWPLKAEYFYAYECPLLSPVLRAADEPAALALSKPASCTRAAV